MPVSGRLVHALQLFAGEVPGLFAPNELEQIVNDVREWVEASGQNPTREGCYSAFINRVRDNLHIVLTMSPVGDAFRSRCANSVLSTSHGQVLHNPVPVHVNSM